MALAETTLKRAGLQKWMIEVILSALCAAAHLQLSCSFGSILFGLEWDRRLIKRAPTVETVRAARDVVRIMVEIDGWSNLRGPIDLKRG